MQRDSRSRDRTVVCSWAVDKLVYAQWRLAGRA
jgi:hypothetical protein